MGRRLEEHGEHGGVLVIDDYGHHPTEVGATLAVAREFGRPVAVLFQPHRYSRTACFVREFADVLAGAAEVGLLPVYAAGEDPAAGCGSEAVAEALAAKETTGVTLLDGPEAIGPWLEARVPAGSLLLTLGAGDIGREVGAVCARLDRRGGN